MQVDIVRDVKLTKVDHLFVLLAENKLDGDLPEKPARHASPSCPLVYR